VLESDSRYLNLLKNQIDEIIFERVKQNAVKELLKSKYKHYKEKKIQDLLAKIKDPVVNKE
jgi:hypothetical protein